MKPEQAALVQSTWHRVSSRPHELAHAFYSRIFLHDPRYRRLFPADMREQQRALMEFLNLVVNGVSCFEDLAPEVGELGLRHARYGVQREDFNIVREAFLGALADVLGRQFTESVSDAWAATYDQLANVMLDAGFTKAATI